MKKKGIRYIKKYTMLTIACGIFGIGVALFVDPNDLAPGGFTGLAIMEVYSFYPVFHSCGFPFYRSVPSDDTCYL